MVQVHSTHSFSLLHPTPQSMWLESEDRWEHEAPPSPITRPLLRVPVLPPPPATPPNNGGYQSWKHPNSTQRGTCPAKNGHLLLVPFLFALGNLVLPPWGGHSPERRPRPQQQHQTRAKLRYLSERKLQFSKQAGKSTTGGRELPGRAQADH